MYLRPFYKSGDIKYGFYIQRNNTVLFKRRYIRRTVHASQNMERKSLDAYFKRYIF